MRTFLLCLIAISALVAQDPDDDTIPAAGKPAPIAATSPAAAGVVAPAQAPASSQDPNQARADAIHTAQAHPAPKDAAPAAPVDPLRGGYPESAHKAFAAREAFWTWAKAHPGASTGPSKTGDLMDAYLLKDIACLNSWFSDPAHLPACPNDAAHHQLWLLCSQVRSSISQHSWPCWKATESKDIGKCQPLIDLGCAVGQMQGPDWLDDLCDGAHKGTHRTN